MHLAGSMQDEILNINENGIFDTRGRGKVESIHRTFFYSAGAKITTARQNYYATSYSSI